MRTTLDIADDIMAAVRAIAREQKKTIGEVISELARTALRRPVEARSRGGVPVLKVRDPDVRITLEMVNALRDEAP
jgi:hypothetical protein